MAAERMRFSAEDRQRAVDLFLEGETAAGIAAEFGCTRETAWRWIRAWYTENYMEKALALGNLGYTPAAIALKLDIPKRIIVSWFRKEGTTREERQPDAASSADCMGEGDDHMDNRDGIRKRMIPGMGLTATIITAAVIAFIVGAICTWAVNAITRNQAMAAEVRTPSYYEALESSFGDMSDDLAILLSKRNAEAERINRLSDQIERSLYEFERATEYLALYDSQIEYLKNMASDTAGLMEKANGNMRSPESLLTSY